LQAAPFKAFAPFVSTRWDDRWLYVESDGLPHVPGGTKPGTFVFSHPMMVGITAWQQQVPLPQSYRGANAWQIPLKPELADTPVSAKEQLFRGAIALAANGVPIFNPIKNDGKHRHVPRGRTRRVRRALRPGRRLSLPHRAHAPAEVRRRGAADRVRARWLPDLWGV
jgi:hypothetical protein